jgi:elongation factor P
MSQIEVGQLRRGSAIMIDGNPTVITGLEFVKPGKGQGLYKCKLRNLTTGALYDRTFRSSERFEEADVTQRDMQYLYKDGDSFYFMDKDSYEQVFMPADQVAEQANFLKDGIEVKMTLHASRPIEIELPNFVTLEVTMSPPGVKGDTSGGATKAATMETGLELQVPLFINEGELLKVDTRTSQYVERVKA